MVSMLEDVKVFLTQIFYTLVMLMLIPAVFLVVLAIPISILMVYDLFKVAVGIQH